MYWSVSVSLLGTFCSNLSRAIIFLPFFFTSFLDYLRQRMLRIHKVRKSGRIFHHSLKDLEQRIKEDMWKFPWNKKQNPNMGYNLTATFIFLIALRPHAGHGLLIHEVSRSHTTTHHSRKDSSGRVISSSQRPLPDNTQHTQHTSMPPVGFERTISSGERPQTYALDRAATGTGYYLLHSTRKLPSWRVGTVPY